MFVVECARTGMELAHLEQLGQACTKQLGPSEVRMSMPRVKATRRWRWQMPIFGQAGAAPRATASHGLLPRLTRLLGMLGLSSSCVLRP